MVRISAEFGTVALGNVPELGVSAQEDTKLEPDFTPLGAQWKLK